MRQAKGQQALQGGKGPRGLERGEGRGASHSRADLAAEGGEEEGLKVSSCLLLRDQEGVDVLHQENEWSGR